jgi:hypothetical protein
MIVRNLHQRILDKKQQATKALEIYRRGGKII